MKTRTSTLVKLLMYTIGLLVLLFGVINLLHDYFYVQPFYELTNPVTAVTIFVIGLAILAVTAFVFVVMPAHKWQRRIDRMHNQFIGEKQAGEREWKMMSVSHKLKNSASIVSLYLETVLLNTDAAIKFDNIDMCRLKLAEAHENMAKAEDEIARFANYLILFERYTNECKIEGKDKPHQA